MSIRFAARQLDTTVWRDGKPHDWSEHAKYLYRDAFGQKPVIEQEWLGGTMTIRAGNSIFKGTVDDQGLSMFKNE